MEFVQVGTQINLRVATGLLKSCGHWAGVIDLCLTLAARLDPHDLAIQFHRNGARMDDDAGWRALAARGEPYAVSCPTSRNN